MVASYTTFTLQVELRAEHERDAVAGGAGGRHGQAVGHRGVRRHEELINGKQNASLLSTFFNT